MKKLLIIALSVFPGWAMSQQIKGIVTTSGDGVLPAATVQTNGMSTQTDLTGRFTLLLNDTGRVVITISYLGYSSRQIELNVQKGLNELGNIILEPASTTLGEIVVKGASAGSQIKAISIKRNASGIMEVLASDAIGKLPDRNAAEAIQRIQGVSIERDMGEGRYASVRGTPIQWSSSLLNGNRMPSASGDYTDRRIQMDIFPSELIQYVQLSKAITPDMEGDAIGGSINFITKTAPVSRILNISAAGGYNKLSRASSYNTSLVYGDRVFNNKLGFIVSGVVWDRTTGTDRYNMTYNFGHADPVQSFSIADLQLRDYIANRRTLGFNGGLEYEINRQHKIFAKGIYSEYLDKQEVHETYFNFDANNAQIQSRAADYLTRLHSIEVGGNSILTERLSFDWAVSMDESSFRFVDPGYPIATFQQSVTYEGLSSDGRKYLRMDSPDGIGDVIDNVLPHLSTSTPIDPALMRLARMTLIRSKNSEENKRAAVDFKYNASQRLTLKFGGKFIHKEKSVDNAPYTITMAGLMGIPAPSIADLGTDPFPYNGGFLTTIGSPYNNVLIDHIALSNLGNMISEPFRTQYGLLTVIDDQPDNASGATKYFTGTEDVYAVYAMGEYKATDKLTFTGGIRNEYNKVVFSGKEVINKEPNGTEINPLEQDNSYNAFLPMLHIKYNVTPDNIIRLAYTRTFARADFHQLNPATVQDDVNRVISRGNASLQPTFASNFDLMAEHYFGGIGLLNAGVFYKKLSNLIYTNQSTETINGVLYAVSAPDNLQSAWLAGFEIGISKRFSNLPGLLKGLGVEANYTFTDSKVKIPRFSNGVMIEDESVIPKQARHLFNASVVYEYGKVMARIAGNYKGKYLDVIRQEAGPEHYRWYAQNFTVDFSASYLVSPKIRFFAELNNITNAPVRFYHGTYDRTEQAEWYSFRGQVGISAKLF